MTLSNFHRSCLASLAAVALFCLSGCAVPLAPGYSIQKQSITVHFVPGSPPHLAVRAQYRLANVGNSSLESIEVGLPSHKEFGRENLRVQVQGHEVSATILRGEDVDEGESSSPDAWPVVFRIPFSPAWPRKQKRNLLITYDLTAALEPHLRMYLGPRMFYLNDSGWFPDPLAPKAFLAKDLVRPTPSDLSVIVPETFLATGSGELRAARKSRAETEYHFRIGKDDFDPYVIAGQYHEQRVTTADGTVIFWAFNPIDSAQAQFKGAAIAAILKDYVQTFGPLPGSMKAVYDISFPEEMGKSIPKDEYGTSFLPGVVNAASQDIQYAQMDLADTWFSHLIVIRPDAWTLAAGLEFYSAIISSPGNNQATGSDVRSAISEYDSDHSHVIEKPILAISPTDPQNQLQLVEDKLQLLNVALEDKCGRDNLNHAISHMVSALRFQQYGYDDFRSAVEEECHQDLGPFFRQWLNEKGIPADFRAKYEAASQRKN